MKKLLYFAVLTLLTACHADNLDEIAEAGGAVVPSAADRVPVLLSISPASSSATEVTRAPLLNEDVNGNFKTPEGQYLGVFALAQTNAPAGGKTGPVNTDAIQWDRTVNICPLWNQPMTATYANNSTTLQFIDKATLNSTPTAMSCYYPTSSWYNYYFYTYYPRVDDNKISVSNNVVKADYTLNGSQDIITAVAMPASNPNSGYCAKYFRDDSEAPKPQLALKHQLAQLRFYVCSDKKPRGTFLVEKITLLDVPTDWSLTIADKSNTENTGKLTSRSAAKSDLPVRVMTINDLNVITEVSDDEVYVENHVDTLRKAKKCVGYAMVPTTEMITTANSTMNRYFDDSLRVEIVTSSNDTIKTDTCTFKANGGFLNGKVYNVILTIKQGAGGQTPEDQDPYPYVDLDLPSGLLWATINIGADPEEEDEADRALIFSWASKDGVDSSNDDYNYKVKNTFTTARAPYRNGTSWTQYNNSNHKVTVLESKDDAATQLWKYTWRMPTKEEYEYLISNTNQSWVDNYNNTGVSGVKFMSKSDPSKYIFFCVNGYRQGITDNNPTHGYYWSSTRGTNQNYAYCLHFYSNSGSPVVEVIQTLERRHGLSIRAVKPKQ